MQDESHPVVSDEESDNDAPTPQGPEESDDDIREDWKIKNE